MYRVTRVQKYVCKNLKSARQRQYAVRIPTELCILLVLEFKLHELIQAGTSRPEGINVLTDYISLLFFYENDFFLSQSIV